MGKPVLIGIAGGTGSGKTTIASVIEQAFANHVMVIKQDSYYKSFNHLPFEERAQINFDHPDAFDLELLKEHLLSLSNRVPVEIPVYDYKTHSRVSGSALQSPKKIIVLEGILIFADQALRQLMDIKLYVDTDADVRILRRIERDMNERGRSLQSVINQYRQTVRPMHIEFVEPTKRFADIIIPEGGNNKIAMEMILSRVEQILNGSPSARS